MHKDNKVLVGSVFIIIIAIIAFSNMENITGHGVRESEKTFITLSPEVTLHGERIHITISTGPEGVNNKAGIFNLIDNLRVGEILICKGSYKCSGKFSTTYVISNALEEGVYEIKVYSYDQEEFISKRLTITSS